MRSPIIPKLCELIPTMLKPTKVGGMRAVTWEIGKARSPITIERVQINPNYALAYDNRGNPRRALGDNKGALADYNEAVRISPNFALTYDNRGNVIRELGNNKGAVADYNEALRIEPNDAFAYDNRGDARRALGDRQGAIADFQKAANLFQQQGNKNDYQNTLNKIANLKPQI